MLYRNAEQLVASSHRVFIGVCISVEEKEIPEFATSNGNTFSTGDNLCQHLKV